MSQGLTHTKKVQRRVLVTGGAGFIGSHLVERLLLDDHSVTVVDNFATGDIGNLEQVKDHSSVSIHNVDVSNSEDLEGLFNGVEWVFHLAALADIVPSIKDPLAYHKANVDGTVAVLETARRAGVTRFIYAASSSCYGVPDQYPTPESAPIRLMYPYALTKYIAEQYVLHWGRVYKLPVVSLRLFNVYGPRARTSSSYGAVFGVFLAQKLSGKPFTVVGDGTQTRDFTFVSDVVQSLVSAAESTIRDEVFNVGAGKPHSINQLVEVLEGPVVYVPKRPGEPDCTYADISKISKALHWSPKISFEQGVRSVLDNIEQWKDAPVWDSASIADSTKDWFRYLGDLPEIMSKT